jgi:Domain of unknown function (DUF1906)
MTKIIDTNNDTTNVLAQLKGSGVETIIRYISTSTQREKCVKPPEAKAIAVAGLKLGLVFEVWGGSDDFSHGDINSDSGAQHGQFARNWAASVGAPDGTIIWFAIDNDVSQDQFARLVQPYFAAVKTALSGKYRTGIYGCGFACQRCLDSGLADAAWLSNAMGWNGSKNFRTTNRWHLLQGPDTHLCGLSVDTNDANENDYGAFVPWQAVPALQPSPAPTPTPTPAPAPAPASLNPQALDAIIAAIGDAFSKAMQATPTATSPRPPPTTSPQQGTPATPMIDFTALSQLFTGLNRLNATLAGVRPPQAGAAPPILSPIDKALGGQAMIGLKTPLAIIAYAGMWIVQSFGAVGTATGANATTTGQVLTALVAAFGGLGLTSKLDRGVQGLSALAGSIQKLQTPPSNPGGIS